MNGSSNGSDGLGHEASSGIVAPEFITELGVSCEQFVLAVTKLELDGTRDTLPILDHYILVSREELRTRPEALPLVAQAVGAYLGSVITPMLNGFWRIPNRDDHNWLVCGGSVFLAFNPVGMAYDALFGTQDHNGPSSELKLAREDEEGVKTRLALLPQVREEDYYRLSTRVETLEIVIAVLKEQSFAAGHGDVSFEPDDYENIS